MNDAFNNQINKGNKVIVLQTHYDNRFESYEQGIVEDFTKCFVIVSIERNGRIVKEKKAPHRLIVDNSEIYKNNWMYLMAEFDNYKKSVGNRMQIEMNLIKNKVINTLLSILDNLEYAYKSNNDEGLKVIIDDIYHKLEYDHNVITIDEYLKDKKNIFDSNYFEAIAVNKVDNEDLDNTINSIVKTGFIYKDGILIRNQQVIVNKYSK